MSDFTTKNLMSDVDNAAEQFELGFGAPKTESQGAEMIPGSWSD